MSRYSLKKSAHDEGAPKEKIPQGFYEFQITDYKETDKNSALLETKNGDPKLWLICEVVNSAKDDGKTCINTLVFYKPKSPSIKGIGMTRHFLKCIGEPWEGDLEPEPSNWVGKRFKAEVIHKDGFVNLVEIQASEQPKKEEIAWDGE